MKILTGDTVVLKDKRVGIVERRDGAYVVLRLPNEDNRRESFPRAEARLLASLMAEARERGSKFSNSLSLTGQSTLSALVAEFGYSTERLRQESVDRVVRQLGRVGLEISTEWGRDDAFVLRVREDAESQSIDDSVGDEPEERGSDLSGLALSEPYWPSALGLEQSEVAFLRALGGREPILCRMFLPERAETRTWLGPTWEGLTSWAYRSAQRFMRASTSEVTTARVVIASTAHLQAYLQRSAIDEHLRLDETPRSLNLVVVGPGERPVEDARLRAIWPGPVFDFQGENAASSSVIQLLFAVGGNTAVPIIASNEQSPLDVLLWAKAAHELLLSQGTVVAGEFLAGLSSQAKSRLKGSNESSTSLALKARLAHWLRKRDPAIELAFEVRQEPSSEVEGEKIMRADLDAGALGVFEIESMSASGPLEAFLHQKVFSRVQKNRLLNVLVPNDALLWAGPFLSDAAHHLGASGQILISHANGFSRIAGRLLSRIEFKNLESSTSGISALADIQQSERRTTLDDIAGYRGLKDKIRDEILWPEKNRRLLKGLSKASGILLFGPPGCGKTRFAQAIAGALMHDVRLLAPSDLRGAFVGWGQIQIREQFAWLMAQDQRMLVIDELDAVARSRRDDQMHSDEKADVNELLVQLDRALRMNRIVVGTTNFVDALDEAVIRSGRIGTFIPVPPPDIDEAVDIVTYYLRRPAADSIGQRLHPGIDDVRSILTPEFDTDGQRFCGADLETAVNGAWVRAFRRQLPAQRLPDAVFDVTLSVDDLRAALRTRRSISKESFDRFCHERDRYGAHESS
jgi:energy-coupling factor transporter ATP-binding protein EcfA2